MFTGIEFREEQVGNEYCLNAYRNNETVGILEYGAPDEGEPYELDTIKVNPQERGLGNELLRRFVEIIGPDKAIKGNIIHEGTVNWLARNGFYNGVSADFSRVFTNPYTLEGLPFGRFLKRAGVELISLATSYNERDFKSGNRSFPYEVSFSAKTKT